MRKKIGRLGFVVVAVFLSQTTPAQVPELFEKTSRAVNRVGQQPCLNCSVMASAQVPSSLTSCIQELCPNPLYSLSLANEGVIRESMNLDSAYNKMLLPLVEKFAVEKMRNSDRKIQLIEAALKKSTIVRDPNLIRLIEFMRVMSNISKVKLKKSGASFDIDWAAIRQKFPKATEYEINSAFVLMMHAMKSEMPFTSTSLQELRIKYPDRKLQEKVDSTVLAIEKSFMDAAKDPELAVVFKTPSLRKEFATKLADVKKNKASIDSSFIVQLNELHLMKLFMIDFSRDSKIRSILRQEPIDLKKYDTEVGGIERLKRDQATRRAVIGTDNLRSSECRYAAAMGAEILPSEKEIVEFKRESEKTQAQFKTAIAKFLSPESFAKLKPSIAAWRFVPPESKDNFAASLKSAIQSKLDDEIAGASQAEEVYTNPSIAPLALATSLTNQDEYEPPLHELNKLCKEMTPSLLPDAAYRDQDGVLVGPLTIRFPKEAANVLNHEMGHLLNAAIDKMKLSEHTSQWFQQSRACLVASHVEKDETRLREDWADLIAANLDSESNFACSLVQGSPALEPLLSTRNPDDDNHSSDLFRLLHIASIQRGKLPAACTQALGARGESVSFKNCAVQSEK